MGKFERDRTSGIIDIVIFQYAKRFYFRQRGCIDVVVARIEAMEGKIGFTEYIYL
jgi:hypothetical protein